MKDFAAIDFETANSNRSSVCSVGIVIVKDGAIAEKIYSLISPRPNFYTYWTTQVHGLTSRDTATASDFATVWGAIAPKIEGMPLVAHNSPFDEGCLKAVHQLFGLTYPEYQFFCTLKASRRVNRELCNHQLQTVAAHYGYDLANHHHALADAEACAIIALELL